MKITAIILWLLILACVAHAQVTGSMGKEIRRNPLIIVSGESNALGLALVSELTTAEKAARSNLQILKPGSLRFESLDININQMEPYADHVDSAENGLEISMAAETDTGRLNATTYYVKAGASGARINWYMDSTYMFLPTYNAWKVLAQRMDTAIQQMTIINNGLRPALYMVWMQGLNDAAASTLHWKDSTEKLFQRIRTRWGRVVILMPYLMSDTLQNTNPTSAQRAAFNADILTMASEVREFYPIPVYLAALKNENHWNNDGFKLIGKRMVQILISHHKY